MTAGSKCAQAQLDAGSTTCAVHLLVSALRATGGLFSQSTRIFLGTIFSGTVHLWVIFMPFLMYISAMEVFKKTKSVITGKRSEQFELIIVNCFENRFFGSKNKTSWVFKRLKKKTKKEQEHK